MITLEQKAQVLNYLLNQKIPVDLGLEIQDHMLEQMEILCENGSTFDEAFEHAKLAWGKDLELRYDWPFLRKKPKIVIDASWRITGQIYRQSLILFLPWLNITFLMTLYFPTIFKDILFGMFCAMVGIFALIYIKNRKLIHSSSGQNRESVSLFQRGAVNLSTSVIYLCMFDLLGYSDKFDRFRNALLAIFITHHFAFKDFATILLTTVYVWLWIIGLLYFRQYKKAVAAIKNKVKLNF